jgi:hypothetical protein
MAIVSFNGGARPGVAVAEVVNGNNYTLIVRVVGEPDGGFEIGFSNMIDAAIVKANAKGLAPDLSTAIDAAFA